MAKSQRKRPLTPVTSKRVIVIDPSASTREVLARRLSAQGYVVEQTGDPAMGAEMALAAPPAAVVADLWMPTISGVQLCRLLRSEPATAAVAILLCGDTDEPKNRFWAARAGANACVSKGRTGDVVRALAEAIASSAKEEGFFFQMSGGSVGVRDRIAQHLDEALFDAVIAAEVRALASCETFGRLFDLLVQFLSQVISYRWIAVSADSERCLGIHHALLAGESAEAEVRTLLDLPAVVTALKIEEADAFDVAATSPAIVYEIPFGDTSLGKIAISLRSQDDTATAAKVMSLVARELAGPIRITSLIEESRRLASTDPLTGLLNRRAFAAAMEREVLRSERHGYPLSVALLDLDHFKLVNDRRGHASGDAVLAAVGRLLQGGLLRRTDLAARWGGEEFVICFLSTPIDRGALAAERVRGAIENLVVFDARGEPVPITASLGLVELTPGETMDTLVARADRAMYASKAAGRNRVSIGGLPTPAASLVVAAQGCATDSATGH